MASFQLERDVKASPEQIFEVLTDHRGYQKITPVRRVELEREGDPSPNGVGAIRVIHSVGPPLREEVIAYVPSERFSYKLLSGAPLREHVGTVELIPQGDRTRVVYVVRTIPTLPIGGSIAVAVARRGVTVLLNAIVAESERRAAAG